MTPESIDRVRPETPSEHNEVQSIMTGDLSATTSTLYILKRRKIAPGFGVPARRDFSSIAVAMQLKSQRSWRDK
jgi:hypothetical protein